MPAQAQQERTPYIVDEENVVADSVLGDSREDHKGGLLSVADCGGVLLSMSGYDKPQEWKQQDYGYGYTSAATRPDQSGSYPAFAQPGYDVAYTGTHAQVPSGLPNAAELPMMSEDQYASHDTSYNQQQGAYQSYIPAASRHLPEVTSFSPTQGPAGRKLFVYLNAVADLETPPAAVFTIMFGSKRCETVLSKLSNQSQRCNYALSVDVPPFDATGSTSTQVPVYMDMTDGSSSSASMPVHIGYYGYTDATAYQMPEPSPSSRKRKLSPTATPRSPGKKPSLQQLETGPASSPPSMPNTAQYASYPRVFSGNQQYQSAQTTQSTPGYGVSPHASAPHINQQRPQTPTYSPYGGYLPSERASAPASASVAARTPILPSPSSSANPPLVRTTALQSSPTSSLTGTGPGTPFNPYAIYPSNTKAVLKLEGDLNSMAESWTPDEWEAKRRLVRFQRSQNGSTITATFSPVTPEEHARAPGSIYVNCIWWEEKQMCYVTSVDTIQLLEALVAVRFTVEEKNRIRRNLEGFRPLTVSKTRPDCDEFFKIIMGFPSPKPRNIEKDVKVFPWRILSTALKKIIGKYSASYASTAASLPASSGAGGSAGASGSALARPTISPSSAGSTASTLAYPPTMTATTLPMSAGHAHHQHSHSHSGVLSTPSGQQHQSQDLRLTVPTSHSHSQSISWHQPSSHYSTELPTSGRGSWDFSQYQWEGAHLQPHAGHYQRIPSISQSLGYPQFMPAPDYRDYSQRTSEA